MRYRIPNFFQSFPDRHLSPLSGRHECEFRSQTCPTANALDIDPSAWHKAMEGSPTQTIFQTLPWLQSWWRTFGHPHQNWLLPLIHQGRSVGWAPLWLNEHEHLRTLRFIGSGNADYLDLITDGETQSAVLALLERLTTSASGWDQTILENIPMQSDTWGLLERHAKPFGLFCLCRPVQRCPSLLVDGHEAEVRQMAGKYSLRRPQNRLARLGELRIYDVASVDEGLALLPAFFEQHIRRWQDTSNPSLFLRDKPRIFYAELVRQCLPLGWLLFTVVELNGKPLSFHFGFDYGGVVTWYKPSYDLTWAKYSPGQILVKHLIDYTLAHQRRELDFTIGDEEFKQRFTNTIRSNVEVRLYRRRRDFARAKLRYHTGQIVRQVLYRT